jgi:hypothetical protein
MAPVVAVRRWLGRMEIAAERFQPIVQHRQEALAFF